MIEAKNLSKEYVLKNKTIVAVKDVSFTIESGETIGLIGENGAGKSTLIKIMCGILTPNHGNCEVNSLIPYKKRKENALNIGALFGQRSQLWWDLPVSDTFEVIKIMYRMDNEKFSYMKAWVIEKLELDSVLQQPVRTLSLGQRMKAEIAATLIHCPTILYLDEPTIGLDVLVKHKIRDVLSDYQKMSGATLIVTSHDLGDIKELCTRLLVLDKGNLLYDGPINQFEQKYGGKVNVSIVCENDVEQFINSIKSIFELENTIVKGQNVCFVLSDKLKIADLVGAIGNMNPLDTLEIKNNSMEEIVKNLYES